jgi:hypothetical protein
VEGILGHRDGIVSGERDSGKTRGPDIVGFDVHGSSTRSEERRYEIVRN